MLYFDHNATAPLLPETRAAWLSACDEHWFNPGAVYRGSVRAALALDKARATLAELCGCPSEGITFTGGATETANGIFSACARNLAGAPVFLSAIEHPCVERAATLFCGADRVQLLPVSQQGVVRVAESLKILEQADTTGVLALMAANNETGAIQPCAEIFEAARKLGFLTVCDASQWPGRIPLSQLPNADFIFFGAHKCGGPKGTGVFINRLAADSSCWALNAGGGQENGIRSGTENLPAILAMIATFKAVDSVEPAARDGSQICLRILRQQFGDECTVFAENTPKLWNTLYLALPDFPASRWVTRLQAHGFYVGTGAGCSAQSDQPSKVLLAMGFDASVAQRTLRLSSNLHTTNEDWVALAKAILTCHKELEDSAVIQI